MSEAFTVALEATMTVQLIFAFVVLALVLAVVAESVIERKHDRFPGDGR